MISLNDIYVLNDGSGFIAQIIQKSDWYNLYYYDWDGKLIVTVLQMSTGELQGLTGLMRKQAWFILQEPVKNLQTVIFSGLALDG